MDMRQVKMNWRFKAKGKFFYAPKLEKNKLSCKAKAK